jgi:hypothetical protein
VKESTDYYWASDKNRKVIRENQPKNILLLHTSDDQQVILQTHTFAMALNYSSCIVKNFQSKILQTEEVCPQTLAAN